MGRYVSPFEDIDRTGTALVGGKGANLGELARIPGIRVPPGFCVTTAAFERIVAAAPSLPGSLDRIARLDPHDRDGIATLSAAVRRTLEAIAVPGDIAAEIRRELARLGADHAYAVRSSATAEDSATTSFAGQLDTYLDIAGFEAILEHVSRCWASLYTDRAVSYRLRSGIDHRTVQMAVVVQQMVFPDAAGTMFTADPVSGNRTIVAVEATLGLGEALVSGSVNGDVFRVRNGTIVAREIAHKQRATHATPSGGVTMAPIDSARGNEASLSDAHVIELAEIGRHIEAHFGAPQDVEWCLASDGFAIVQSRPITTLFPIPSTPEHGTRVYLSVGHNQMMTDPMRPLGLSMFQLTTIAPMRVAAGRLFVDVTRSLTSPAGRAGLMAMARRSDPIIGDALQTLVDREEFLASLPNDPAPIAPPRALAPNTQPPLANDPAIPAALIAHGQASNERLKHDLKSKSGLALLDFIRTDLKELQSILFGAESHRAIMAGIEAVWWLNDHLSEWLGEKGAADILAQSAPNNVTSEMGLALLDVADVIRRYPDVVAFLERAHGDDFLETLPTIAGGQDARDAIERYLDKYGMRGVGEIDITNPRWRERPSALLPMMLTNIRSFETGAAERRFERGHQAAEAKRREVLDRLRALPDGREKAEQTEGMIERVRTFIGYREYPKYFKVTRYFAYKQALLEEARRLMESGVIGEHEDIFFLTFDELEDVVRAQRVDARLIRQRKDEFESYRAMVPPRVLTSEGEMVSGSYRRNDIPPGALVGVAVSAGTVEGRARVITDTANVNLEPGDILVTTFTDPSWTPAFVAISGLVTEVGGLMTHGAVIAREYGLPAIVGVEHATRRIRDGARIRVHGTDGYVEIVSEDVSR